MNQILKILGLTGILVLVLTVRALAAPDLQMVSPQTAILTPQMHVTLASPDTTGQGTGVWGGRMGGGQMGRMGRGMMGSSQGTQQGHMGRMSGSAANMFHETMMDGATAMPDDIAMQMGKTTGDLYNQMANGMSLVQIASEKGITEQQLMDNIMAGRQTAYGQAVMSGHMTQTQANTMLQNLNDNLQTLVNGQGSGSSGWGMMWDTQPGSQTTFGMHH